MNLFYHLAYNTLRVGLRFLFDRRVIGLEKLPDTGVLIAANHVSFYDPPFISAVISHRRVTWLGKRELDQRRPDIRALREALRRVERGEVVGIFPEGGRSVPGAELPVRSGVAMLAQRAQAPVVPIGVSGTRPLARWNGWRLTCSRVWFRIGDPIPPPPPGRLDEDERAAYTARVMSAINGLVALNEKAVTGDPRTPASLA